MKAHLNKPRVFGALLTLGLFAMATRNVTDPDFWWHLRSGQLILQNHAVFHTDPYSFTRFGHPWINHEWLSDIIVFGVYRVAGWGGLIVAFAAITAAIFLFTFLRCSGNASIALLITLCAAFASAPLWGARPQMFSLLLISLFLLILEGSCVRPRLLWWLLPLLLLWVNLHAGYLAGIGLLLIFLAGDALDSVLGRAPWPKTAIRARNLALVLIASLALVPLNPYGWKMYGYPLATLHSKAMQVHIAEWFSPDFHQAQYWLALLLMLASILIIAYAPRRLLSRDLILLLTTMYMGLRSQRHLAIFALVAAPILSNLASAWLKERGWFFATSAPATSSPLSQEGSAKVLANLAIFLALASFAVLRVQRVVNQQPQAEAAHFPAAAATFLMTSRPNAAIFNYYDWGGYFIWKLYPEYRVYIDGRADLYGDAFMDQFSADYDCRADCGQNSLNAWHIQTVILPPKAPLIMALEANGDWLRIYSDSQVAILSRKIEQSANKTSQVIDTKLDNLDSAEWTGSRNCKLPYHLPGCTRVSANGGNNTATVFRRQ